MTAHGYQHRPENISPEKIKNYFIATVVVFRESLFTLVMGLHSIFYFMNTPSRNLRRITGKLRDMDI